MGIQSLAVVSFRSNGNPTSVIRKSRPLAFDTDRIDVEMHSERIITNVLNLGTHEALLWLFSTYPRERIAEVVAHPRPGEWNTRSLNYWALVFDIEPTVTSRF